MSASPIIATRREARHESRFRACHRAITTVVAIILSIASRALRRPDPVWFGLNDHLLADIGETRAKADAEAARSFWNAPPGTMADGATSRDPARPRLPFSRFD
jgi:hypothetical protein